MADRGTTRDLRGVLARSTVAVLTVAALAVLCVGAGLRGWLDWLTSARGAWTVPVAAALGTVALLLGLHQFRRSRVRRQGTPQKGVPLDLKWALVLKYEHNDDRQSYISGRWWDGLMDARDQWKRDRRWYMGCRLVMIVGGVALPASVSGQAALENNAALIVVSVAISLAVAISGGIMQLARTEDRYILRMLQHHRLESAGWELLMSHDEGAFVTFTTGVEAAMATYRTEVVRALTETTEGVGS